MWGIVFVLAGLVAGFVGVYVRLRVTRGPKPTPQESALLEKDRDVRWRLRMIWLALGESACMSVAAAHIHAPFLLQTAKPPLAYA